MPSDERDWSSIENPADSSQCTTAVDFSGFWTEAITDTRTGEDEKPDSGVEAIKKPILDFPSDIDAQGQGIYGQRPPTAPGFEYDPKNDIDFNAIYGSLTTSNLLAQRHGTFGQEPAAVPGFEYIPNNDMEFNAICGSLTPSVLLSCISDEHTDSVLKYDAVPVTENADEFFAGTDDHFLNLCSPASDFQVGPSNPQVCQEDIDPCTLHKRSCMVNALKILRALHISPSVCLSTGATASDTSSSRPRMTDCVLSANREAARWILDILECACSSSPQVQLVITVICSKIIAWCRAVVRNGFEESSVMQSTRDKHNVNHGDQTERVSHQPITVGEYSIDVTLEYRIRAQVVFNELQHVEALTQTLSRRVKETKFGEDWNIPAAQSGKGRASSSRSAPSDWGGNGEAVHGSLTVSLCKQLQAGKEEVTALMQGGPGSACVSGHASDMDE